MNHRVLGAGPRHAHLSALLACAAAISPWVAQAQTAPARPVAVAANAQTGTEVSGIVVTAEKRAELLVDVPSSISVVSAQDIKNQNLIELSDIADRTPNVLMLPSNMLTVIAIRGVSSIDSGNSSAGFAPGAAVYVDDVYQGDDRATNLPLANISQIEVLRGPQGTLYGQNTISGAVNITTKKPTDRFEADLDAQYGSLDFTQVTGTVSGPVAGDQLLVSLSGFYRHQDGDILNLFNGAKLDGDNAYGGRVRAIYQPSTQLTVEFDADYLKEFGTQSLLTTAVIVPLPFPPYTSIIPPVPGQRVESLNSPEFGRREVWGFAGHVDYQFPGVEFTSISSLRGYNSSYDGDFDGTQLSGVAAGNITDVLQYSEELRFTSTGNGPFKWIAGLYGYHEALRSQFVARFEQDFPAFLLGPPFPLPLPAGYDDVESSQARIAETEGAAFVNGTWDITDRWTLAGGARITIDHKHINFFQLPIVSGLPVSVDGALLAIIPPRQEAFTEYEPTGDVSLSYKFSPDQVAYIKYARGYKAGGFNSGEVVNPFDDSLSLAFKPEFLNDFEGGIKAGFLDNRLTINLDGFYDLYTNKQESVFDPLPPFGIVISNAGKATIYGAELEVVARPFPGLTLDGSLGLLKAYYNQFTSGTANFSGNTLAFAPNNQWSLSATYEHAIPELSDWSVLARVEANHTGLWFSDPQNSTDLESLPVTYVNARVGVESGRWGFYLWGKNLTDVYHEYGGQTELLVFTRAVNFPRSVGGEISFKY